MDVDVNTYLPGDLLTKVDITTMACSLEAGSFPRSRVDGVGRRAAGRLKVRRGDEALLKGAVAAWLPGGLLTRPKMGFGVPMAPWLRTELRDLAHDLLTDGTARSRGSSGPKPSPACSPSMTRVVITAPASGRCSSSSCGTGPSPTANPRR